MAANPQTTALAIKPLQAISADFEARNDFLRAQLEGTGMSVMKFTSDVLKYVESSDSLYALCQKSESARKTLVLAALEAAQLGLRVGGPLQHTALVPFKEKVPRSNPAVYVDKVQLIIQYQGKDELALRSRLVSSIKQGHVCENDEFDYEEGVNPFIHHKRLLRGDRGALIAAYAWAQMPDGSKVVVVIDRAAAMAAKAKSKQPEKAWATDEAAMWEKTAKHRLHKNLSKTPALLRAEETGLVRDETSDVIDVEAEDVAEVVDATPAATHGTITVLRPDGSEVSTPAPEAWKMTPEIWTEIQELAPLAGLKLETLTAELGLPAQGRDYQKQHAEAISNRIDEALMGILRELAKKVGLDEVNLAELMANRGMPPGCKSVRPAQFKAFKAELEGALPPAGQTEIGW